MKTKPVLIANARETICSAWGVLWLSENRLDGKITERKEVRKNESKLRTS